MKKHEQAKKRHKNVRKKNNFQYVNINTPMSSPNRLHTFSDQEEHHLSLVNSVQQQSESTVIRLSSHEESTSISIQEHDLEHLSLIEKLPDDIIFLICDFLLPSDLGRLCCVCKKMNFIASKNSVWNQHLEHVLHFKEKDPRHKTSAKELCRTAINWKNGNFGQKFVVKHKRRTMPWVVKSDNEIWLSVRNTICNFSIRKHGLFENKERHLSGIEDDVTQFAVKYDTVVCGSRNGSVHGWSTLGNNLFSYKDVHSSDTQCIDFTDEVIVTGSRDTTCKVLPFYTRCSQNARPLRTFNHRDRIWCLQISPCQKFFAAGIAGCVDDSSTVLWDLETGSSIGKLSLDHRPGAGVLDLKFESPSHLLTCGYDTFVRLWDLRVQECVLQMEDPSDVALYCLESDNSHNVFVGTARHGITRIWDKRFPEPVQTYYGSIKLESPVYKLAYDYGHLYLALDRGLNVLDFTKYYP